jgi:hypothetical protein
MGMDPSLMNVPKTPELDRFIDKIEHRRLKLLKKYYAEIQVFKIEKEICALLLRNG